MRAVSPAIWIGLAFWAGLSCLAGPAAAYPLFSSRPVPSAIAGPTDAHVAAVFYNPAALGPLRGLHVYLDGGARLNEGSIRRAPVENVAASSTDIHWANPDAFVGMSWDLNTDSFVIGLAAYTPLAEVSSFAPGSPVRFHETDQQFLVLEETAAAAYRVSGRFYIGAAANFAQSWFSWRYSRDAALDGGSAGVDQPGGLCGAMPCGLENPSAEQRLRLRGFGWGLGFSVGILARPIDRLWLAAAYTSHIFNTGLGTDLQLHDQTRARVTPASGQGPVCGTLADGTPAACSANDLVTAAVPDLVQLGVRVEVTPRIDVESWARYIHYGIRPQLDVQIQGAQLLPLAARAGGAIPPQRFYDRGLQDTFGVEGSVRFRLGERLRISPAAFYESPAVDPSAVNAAALDGHKVDLSFAAEWHPITHLSLGAHVGVTSHILGDVKSRFSPRAETACVDGHYSLDACQAASAGQGLPSASGHYTLFVVHLSAAIGIDY